MGSSSSTLSRTDLDHLVMQTSLTEKRINGWYSHFIQENPRGYIDKASFHTMFSATEDYAHLADPLFAIFDRDRDGRIDFKDFMLTAFSLVTPDKMDEEWFKFTFHLIDLDKNGLIEEHEAREVVSTICSKEIQKHRPDYVKTRVSELFKHMDTDEDGNLTITEFQSGCQRHPTFKKIPGILSSLISKEEDFLRKF